MNVEIGAEAAQLPEKEYINGIAVAVHYEGKVPNAMASSFFFLYLYKIKYIREQTINKVKVLKRRTFLQRLFK
jgi:hypothetical protein